MKPSQPLLARLRLTTKQVNGGYYKGNRTGSMGFFLKSSTYIIDSRKTRKYIVPESLPDFKLTPFVTKSFPPSSSKYGTSLTGSKYIKMWRELNPREFHEWELDWANKYRVVEEKNKKRQLQLHEHEKAYRAKRKVKGGHPAPKQQLRQFRESINFGPDKS